MTKKKAGIAFLDAFADIGFFIERLTVGDKLIAWLLLGSILIPMLINLILMGKIMRVEFRDDEVFFFKGTTFHKISVNRVTKCTIFRSSPSPSLNFVHESLFFFIDSVMPLWCLSRPLSFHSGSVKALRNL